METSELLDKAADEIERRGNWENGGWYYAEHDGGGPLCLEGALEAAMGLSMSDARYPAFSKCPAYVAVKEYLGWSDGRGNTELWRWNDSVAKTQEEVVGMLRDVATKERLKEQEKVHE